MYRAGAKRGSVGRRGGGGTSQGRSVRPGIPTPHTAPPLLQVVAIDLDEGLNGLVTYRMQVGMPRMDFLINSSSGVVVTTTELDRERIAEYQLRVVASDAGTPTKSSTSTLTIRGERGGASCSGLSTWAQALGQGQAGREPTALLLSTAPQARAASLMRLPPHLDHQHSRAFLVSTSQKCLQSLSPPGRGPCLGLSHCRGLEQGWGPGGHEQAGQVAECSPSLWSPEFLLRGVKGTLPSHVCGSPGITMEGHYPERGQLGLPGSLRVPTPLGPSHKSH